MYSNEQQASQSFALLVSLVFHHLQLATLLVLPHSFRSLIPLVTLPFMRYNLCTEAQILSLSILTPQTMLFISSPDNSNSRCSNAFLLKGWSRDQWHQQHG